jgi:hypothetical protein
MSEYLNQLNLNKNQEAFKKLANDLAEFDANTSSTFLVDNEMLSLVVSEVLKGVDISIRYPTFYRNILKNDDLRQAFIDALGSIENGTQSETVVLPLLTRPALTFLSQRPEQPAMIKLGGDKWRAIWRQSVEQLQSIFSPPELAYRSDPCLYEDPWITLLRDDVVVAGSQYTVLLECSPAVETDDALAVSFNIAVTLETPIVSPQIPLEATLQWGLYNKTMVISEEGRTRFPDVPLSAILDEELQSVKAELSLTLENIS